MEQHATRRKSSFKGVCNAAFIKCMYDDNILKVRPDCPMRYVHPYSIVNNSYHVIMPVLFSSGHPLDPGGGEPRQRRFVKNHCGND